MTDRCGQAVFVCMATLAPFVAGCTLTDLDDLHRSADAAATSGSTSSGATSVGSSTASASGSGGALTSSAASGGGGAAGASSGAGPGGAGGVGGSAPSCTPLAGTNLLLNGGMELGPTPPPGMGTWNGWRAAVAEDDTANGGAKSLRVCKDEQTPRADGDVFLTWADLYPLPPDAVAGWTFEASVCVRAAPGFPAPTSVGLTMHEVPTLDHGGVVVSPLGDEWTLLTVEGQITQAAPSVVSLQVTGSSLPDGTCFLADDAVILHPP